MSIHQTISKILKAQTLQLIIFKRKEDALQLMEIEKRE